MRIAKITTSSIIMQRVPRLGFRVRWRICCVRSFVQQSELYMHTLRTHIKQTHTNTHTHEAWYAMHTFCMNDVLAVHFDLSSVDDDDDDDVCTGV